MIILSSFSDFWAKNQEFILPAIILLSAFLVVKLLRFSLNRYFKHASRKLNTDPTNYVYLKNILSFIIYTIAILWVIYSIPQLRSFAITLFAGAGILVAIVGFASQAAFANIISGLFIVIFKPFRVGDLVSLANNMIGEIENITLRHVVIRDFQNRRIIIPNSEISAQTIVNYNIDEEEICAFFEYGIAYDADVDLASKIIIEEVKKHPQTMHKNDDDGRVEVRVESFKDSSVNLRAMVWIADPDESWKIKHDLNKSIKRRFDAEGVEIPFPYRTIVYKKDLK